MGVFGKIWEEVKKEGTPSEDDVCSAIDNHTRVIISYNSHGEDKSNGARVIEVYAYGLTKLGNPVIRAFQRYGDTTTKAPSWKFFRLDRIKSWLETNQKFIQPPQYPNLGLFNADDDDSMSIIYKIAKFNSYDKGNVTINQEPISSTQPKRIFKTKGENNSEQMKQELNNPINLLDLKTFNGFKNLPNDNTENNNAPKVTEPILKGNNDTLSDKYWDDYEKAMSEREKMDAYNLKRRENRWQGTDNEQGSVDKMYKNRKDSSNRELNDIDDETIKKAMDYFKNKNNNNEK